MSSDAADAPRRIGRVRSVNAQRREVRIAYDPGAQLLDPALEWIHVSLPPEASLLRCKVAAVKSPADGLLVLGAGVPRDTVARLRGATVLVHEVAQVRHGALPAVADMLGLRVLAPAGTVLGTVVGVLEGPANDVIRVERPGGGCFLLPVAEPAIAAVDLEVGTVTVAADLTPYAVDEP